jgi:Uma2 family endonuclease
VDFLDERNPALYIWYMVYGLRYTIDPNLTAMQNFRRLPEGIRAEVIDGKLFVSPTPSTDHQELVQELFLKLYHYIQRNKLGFVTAIPTDVFMKRANAMVPDIFFFSSGSKRIRRERRGYFGAPDLIIVSTRPTTSFH